MAADPPTHPASQSVSKGVVGLARLQKANLAHGYSETFSRSIFLCLSLGTAVCMACAEGGKKNERKNNLEKCGDD